MPSETTRSRFKKTMAGELPADRLPVIEWAVWWNLTLQRWQGEGLPANFDATGIKRYFGLDVDYQLWFPQRRPEARPVIDKPHRIWIETPEDYEDLRPMLYPDPPPINRALWSTYAAEQRRGDAIIWITLEGFFWWPRVLLGVEQHLYAFFDSPELMHRINRDQANYMHRCLDAICDICVPDFMTFAEDMSYNHGPMIGKELFDEFLAPYYGQITPRLDDLGVVPMVDSDGGIEPLIPWFEEVGIAGILPLERMAGVDVNRIRQNHPNWQMIGGFDKTVMHLGDRPCARNSSGCCRPCAAADSFRPSITRPRPLSRSSSTGSTCNSRRNMRPERSGADCGGGPKTTLRQAREVPGR